MTDDDRLRDLEVTVATNTTAVQGYMRASEARGLEQSEINKKLFEMLEESYNTIHGEGGSPGLKGRVDRIEQRNRLVSWAAGIATAAWISQLAKWATEHWKW